MSESKETYATHKPPLKRIRDIRDVLSGACIRVQDVRAYISDPHLHSACDDGTLAKLTDFCDSVDRMGEAAPDYVHMSLCADANPVQGIVAVTQGLKAYVSGKTTPYADY